MRFGQLLTSSLRPLFRHPLRSTLALSGMAIGVAAVLVSRAIGDGAQQDMKHMIETLGTNLIIVKPLPVKRLVARRQLSGVATTFTPEDAAMIENLPSVRVVAPAIEDTVRVKAGGVSLKTTVRGTTAPYRLLRHFAIAKGRFFDAGEERKALRVAVLGASVADQLFPTKDPVGQDLYIRGVPFEIIGVLHAKGTTNGGADQDSQVLIPLKTALRRVYNVRWLTSAYVGITTPESMADAEREITTALRTRHQRGTPPLDDDFAVQNTTKTRAVQHELTATLSRYSEGLALIALLVGGTGVLALMFLSVRERTAEIGLRMAVGAQPRDILLQFLIEATLLALAGWGLGIVIGAIAMIGVAQGIGWTVCVPVTAGFVALITTLVVGLCFGILPACHAARIPPIQALVKK